MTRRAKTTKESIKEERLRVAELNEQYLTQRYFETMPEYDPVYKYCYSTSSRCLPAEEQSVDAWIRAIVKHMASRNDGHGGAKTNAVVISVPTFSTDEGIERWIDYVTEKLRKKAKKSKLRSKPA